MKNLGRKAARGQSAQALKAGARVEEHRLRNGLRVIVAERHTDPVVAVMTWYRVGARNETERECGVSHFLEHMMFKGTPNLGKGEIDRITTRLGGANNAYTSYDHTAYWFELASDRWETALEIEADRMYHLSLDPTEFEAERAVVLEELAMGQDDPWRQLSQRVQAAVFERHPYRRPVIGYPDVLRGLTVDAMRDYYKRFYHPGNATIVLCGDVRAQDALKRVRHHFGAIPRGPALAESDGFRAALDPIDGERRIAMTWDDEGQRLCMAWPTVSFASDDDYALDLAAAALTSGRLSRLYRRLVVDDGLATTVSTNNDTRVEGGVFWLLAEVASGASLEALERAIDEELERLATEPLDRRELARVRSMLCAGEAYSTETATDLAEELGEYAADGDWRMAIDWRERILAVTPARVRDAAGRLLGPHRRVVGTCGPRTAEATAAEEPRPGGGRR